MNASWEYLYRGSSISVSINDHTMHFFPTYFKYVAPTTQEH